LQRKTGMSALALKAGPDATQMSAKGPTKRHVVVPKLADALVQERVHFRLG